MSKIMIQICAKIGGQPWIVENLPLLDEPTMVCGLDVYHATHLNRKSVLGFCASYNKYLTKYWSKSIVQDVGVEVSHHLQSLMDKALKKFHKMNNCMPKRLIFFRDGVGESQLGPISQQEIA